MFVLPGVQFANFWRLTFLLLWTKTNCIYLALRDSHFFAILNSDWTHHCSPFPTIFSVIKKQGAIKMSFLGIFPTGEWEGTTKLRCHCFLKALSPCCSYIFIRYSSSQITYQKKKKRGRRRERKRGELERERNPQGSGSESGVNDWGQRGSLKGWKQGLIMLYKNYWPVAFFLIFKLGPRIRYTLSLLKNNNQEMLISWNQLCEIYKVLQNTSELSPELWWHFIKSTLKSGCLIS